PGSPTTPAKIGRSAEDLPTSRGHAGAPIPNPYGRHPGAPPTPELPVRRLPVPPFWRPMATEEDRTPVGRPVFKTGERRQTCLVGSTPTLFRHPLSPLPFRPGPRRAALGSGLQRVYQPAALPSERPAPRDDPDTRHSPRHRPGRGRPRTCGGTPALRDEART